MDISDLQRISFTVQHIILVAWKNSQSVLPNLLIIFSCLRCLVTEGRLKLET